MLTYHLVDLDMELVKEDMSLNELGVDASMIQQVQGESIVRMSGWLSLELIVHTLRN